MKMKSPLRYTTLVIATLLVISCGNSSNKSEQDQSPSTETAIDQPQGSTASDQQLTDVDSDLASLDADLEVIDQAIADLDSVAP